MYSHRQYWCFSSGFGKDLPYSCCFFRVSRFDCLTIGESGTNSFSASSVDFPHSKTLIQLVLHSLSFLDMAAELRLMKWISVLKCNPSQGGWGQQFLVGALIESPCPKLDVKTIKMET